MPKEITPQLMFTGSAEAAMNFYVSLFARSEVVEVEKFGAGEHGAEGTIKRAIFVVAGQRLACIDSPPVHDFTFTPSFSLFVECENEAEFNNAFEQLSADGKVLMPPDNYGFSRKFGWTNDRFGVSWQLNLA